MVIICKRDTVTDRPCHLLASIYIGHWLDRQIICHLFVCVPGYFRDSVSVWSCYDGGSSHLDHQQVPRHLFIEDPTQWPLLLTDLKLLNITKFYSHTFKCLNISSTLARQPGKFLPKMPTNWRILTWTTHVNGVILHWVRVGDLHEP